MELVASEPLIQSPAAFEWGADGKLWVVEMRDYPSGGVAGAICYLEDTKGDGIYDKSTVFLDGLSFPNGLYPWRNGVLVSAAPDIFSAADTTGSGKADLRRTVLSGFFPGNPQHRVNGFDYGLDNWLYAANGDSGGSIRSSPADRPKNFGGYDLRFQADPGQFEMEAGASMTPAERLPKPTPTTR